MTNKITEDQAAAIAIDYAKEYDVGGSNSPIESSGLTIYRGARQQGIQFTLGQGESLDDYCIVGHLKTPVPNNFPSTYKGVRVLYNTASQGRFEAGAQQAAIDVVVDTAPTAGELRDRGMPAFSKYVQDRIAKFRK